MSTETWPAMIAAVTDFGGEIIGAHRTDLAPKLLDLSGDGKAPTARRGVRWVVSSAMPSASAWPMM